MSDNVRTLRNMVGWLEMIASNARAGSLADSYYSNGVYANDCEDGAEFLRTLAASAEKADIELKQALDERDNYHEWADKLADAIAEHFGADIGEHSSQNSPWAKALEVVKTEEPPASADAWREAVIDACTMAMIEWDENDARESVRRLIEWHVDVALDPRVSERARALQAGAARAPEGWREFIENIATPGSEPLNSVSAFRNNASRRHWMGKLRRHAAELLAAAPASPQAEPSEEDERARFEAWAEANEKSLEPFEDGYEWPGTHDAWLGWKAAKGLA